MFKIVDNKDLELTIPTDQESAGTYDVLVKATAKYGDVAYYGV